MQLVRRILKWLFPEYYRRRELKEKAEIRLLEQNLFSDKVIGRIYCHLRIRRSGGSAKWIIRTASRLEAYLLLNILPSTGGRTVRYTATRIITSVRIDKNSSLTLTEYIFPCRIRMIRLGEPEILFARAVLQMRTQKCEIATFYVAESIA